MNISVGFSPCPNDTFIFDAWKNNKIQTPDNMDFTWIIEDVEELNRRGNARNIDVTKVSFHNYALLQNDYQLLQSGGALGYNCGPLLVGKSKFSQDEISELHVAIPGIKTTAHFLLMVAYPELRNKSEALFSDIEDGVLDGTYDAGLIIHENRFTYREKGLHKIIDLGEYWESQFHAPIPLGGIMVKRSLPESVKIEISSLMETSVQYAFDHPAESLGFMQEYAQDMRPEIMKKHVDLYVNDFTRNVDSEGKRAISVFMDKHIELGFIDRVIEPVWV